MTDIQANYAAQIEAVDESVGRIRKAIKDRGIEDNTIVIYFSDQRRTIFELSSSRM